MHLSYFFTTDKEQSFEKVYKRKNSQSKKRVVKNRKIKKTDNRHINI